MSSCPPPVGRSTGHCMDSSSVIARRVVPSRQGVRGFSNTGAATLLRTRSLA
jgi:hypothetical protein